jgi:hypothetical protein
MQFTYKVHLLFPFSSPHHTPCHLPTNQKAYFGIGVNAKVPNIAISPFFSVPTSSPWRID